MKGFCLVSPDRFSLVGVLGRFSPLGVLGLCGSLDGVRGRLGTSGGAELSISSRTSETMKLCSYML